MPYQSIEELSEAECLRLIAPGGIGRIAYESRFGPAVLPVNYTFRHNAVLFRTAEYGALDEDLRTGITSGEYKVAFEIDDIDSAARCGWSVLIQGPAHHLTAPERDAAGVADLQTWAPGARELFVKIVPTRITGRRLGGRAEPAGRPPLRGEADLAR
jgi:nitroimidazol reductase NimA-like FMN-containing flavoprotein (pyridoxamine 5'-phosphate oxidase superfamily)